jgi:hypothetical protein
MNSSHTPPRQAIGKLGPDGQVQFDWQLTPSSITDPVHLIFPAHCVLPVLFVPGIMGSNLVSTVVADDNVWRLDRGVGGIPTALVGRWFRKGPGPRQAALHPDRTDIDPGGAIPRRAVGSIVSLSQYRDRGWGEVSESSYHDFLLWLETTLHPQGGDPARWPGFDLADGANLSDYRPPAAEPLPLPDDAPVRMRHWRLPRHTAEQGPLEPLRYGDLRRRAGFRMPVYAMGYNWLASNKVAAERLKSRIEAIIAENNRGKNRCEQVVLVTHSMGGLVARCCAMLPGMEAKIAGIVHGVMPALGAAVAYRRCKLGMKDEDPKAAIVIGNDGPKVTAVFAQAPGALQLLPNQHYPRLWLKVFEPGGGPLEEQPSHDPYRDIYLRRDRWWGLIREEWLRPENGISITWEQYADSLGSARQFHQVLGNHYHPTTYVYYGADPRQPSFETVCWRARPGQRPDSRPPPPRQVANMGFHEVRDSGNNPLRVGGTKPSGNPIVSLAARHTSYWDIHADLQDSGGDGTVPRCSGAAPKQRGGARVRQQFRLEGFGHEPSYNDPVARHVTLYSLIKIAAQARGHR